MTRRHYRIRPRDAFVIANRPRLRPKLVVTPSSLLSEIEDRRQFHPEQLYAVPRSFPVLTAIVDRNVNRGRPIHRSNPFFLLSSMRSDRQAFRTPRRVLMCYRRASRREVLFALGRSGRGYRRPRWNYWSHVTCR